MLSIAITSKSSAWSVSLAQHSVRATIIIRNLPRARKRKRVDCDTPRRLGAGKSNCHVAAAVALPNPLWNDEVMRFRKIKGINGGAVNGDRDRDRGRSACKQWIDMENHRLAGFERGKRRLNCERRMRGVKRLAHLPPRHCLRLVNSGRVVVGELVGRAVDCANSPLRAVLPGHHLDLLVVCKRTIPDHEVGDQTAESARSRCAGEAVVVATDRKIPRIEYNRLGERSCLRHKRRRREITTIGLRPAKRRRCLATGIPGILLKGDEDIDPFTGRNRKT